MQQAEGDIENRSEDLLGEGAVLLVSHAGFDNFEVPIAEVVPEELVEGVDGFGEFEFVELLGGGGDVLGEAGEYPAIFEE